MENTVCTISSWQWRQLLDHRLIKTQIGHARDFAWYRGQCPSPARVILSHERVQIHARKNLCSYATNPPHFRMHELSLCDILITRAGDGRWPRYQAKSLACPGCVLDPLIKTYTKTLSHWAMHGMCCTHKKQMYHQAHTPTARWHWHHYQYQLEIIQTVIVNEGVIHTVCGEGQLKILYNILDLVVKSQNEKKY